MAKIDLSKYGNFRNDRNRTQSFLMNYYLRKRQNQNSKGFEKGQESETW